MSEYDVDVIIAVHTASRPIRRAVASVLDHTASAVRVSVVAHNIDAEVIRANLAEYADHAGVRLLSLSDGIPSPAGPMNLGLEEATAPYFALLGSDDELAPGAIDAWLAIARATGATTVLARIDRVVSGTDPYPPVRRGRTRDLDAVKDRLAYRSAPLGLVRRAEFGRLRFTPGLRSGEDLEFTAALWFTGARLAYDRGGPAYIAHEDAEDRVTDATATVADDFAFLDAIERAPWFASLGRAERTALGVKTLRVHYFDAVASRLGGPGIAEHREALELVISTVERMAPGSLALLARVDRKVVDAIRSPDSDPELIRSLLAARWQGGPLGTLATRNPLLALHRQAPYRTMRAMVSRG